MRHFREVLRVPRNVEDTDDAALVGFDVADFVEGRSCSVKGVNCEPSVGIKVAFGLRISFLGRSLVGGFAVADRERLSRRACEQERADDSETDGVRGREDPTRLTQRR